MYNEMQLERMRIAYSVPGLAEEYRQENEGIATRVKTGDDETMYDKVLKFLGDTTIEIDVNDPTPPSRVVWVGKGVSGRLDIDDEEKDEQARQLVNFIVRMCAKNKWTKIIKLKIIESLDEERALWKCKLATAGVNQ